MVLHFHVQKGGCRFCLDTAVYVAAAVAGLLQRLFSASEGNLCSSHKKRVSL